MGKLIVISHPEVVVDPNVPITEWGLNDVGCDRAEKFATSGIMASVRAIWSSTERKALDTASILARPQGIDVKTDARLCENDRSATGFLPPEQFEAAADAFFAAPENSYLGWETASDAQARILSAVTQISDGHSDKDLAIVTHGAVGTLLWCHFSGTKIDRLFDQPGQGHYWSADLTTLRPDAPWHPIA